MIGKILIEDYRVHCIIGAHAHEREMKQDLFIDVELEFDMTQCVLSDSIADTLNYEKVGEVCESLAIARQYHLIETFAYEALNTLFDEFPTVRFVKIRVKKPTALPEAIHAIIEFEKRAD